MLHSLFDSDWLTHLFVVSFFHTCCIRVVSFCSSTTSLGSFVPCNGCLHGISFSISAPFSSQCHSCVGNNQHGRGRAPSRSHHHHRHHHPGSPLSRTPVVARKNVALVGTSAGGLCVGAHASDVHCVGGPVGGGGEREWWRWRRWRRWWWWRWRQWW